MLGEVWALRKTAELVASEKDQDLNLAFEVGMNGTGGMTWCRLHSLKVISKKM